MSNDPADAILKEHLKYRTRVRIDGEVRYYISARPISLPGADSMYSVTDVLHDVCYFVVEERDSTGARGDYVSVCLPSSGLVVARGKRTNT